MKKKRHSNYYYDSNLGIIRNDDGTIYTGDSTGSGSGSGAGLGKDNSGSGMFDWGSFVNTLLSSGTSIVNSIWGKSDTWKADAYNTLYEQEKKTNTILWVVIGLIVALGVFLVIRKTK